MCGERSGAFRDAFIREGFLAFSCDREPSEEPGPHFQADWQEIIPTRVWDLIIIHPTCTSLCVSGNHVYAAGKPRHHERVAACRAVERDWALVRRWSRHAVLENPRGVIATRTSLGRASQSVQPNQFGDDASKATDLWLHNLPLLEPTERVRGRIVEWPKGSGQMVERWSNQTDSGQNRLGPSETRAFERARTYPGIAEAGARQWGAFIRAAAVQVRSAA